MLTVKNIRVWTLTRDALTISWEISDSTLDAGDYTLTILRSDSQAGPFTAVGSAFSADSTDEYTDNTVNLYSKIREHYYRVRVTRSSDGETLDWGDVDPATVFDGGDPGAVSPGSSPDIQASEAIRRMDIMLQEFAGRKALIFTQRTWGTRCTTCWDKLKRRRTRSGCTDCYDTGLTGGYFNAKQAWLMKTPDDVVRQINAVMTLEPSDIIFTLSATPRVKPADLVVDADKSRYRVTRIPKKGEKLWALTHQVIVCRELSKDQVEYDLEVTSEDWDIDPFKADPHRQHVAAVDIDSYLKHAQALGVEDS